MCVQCMLYAANSFRMQNSREAKQNGKQQETALLPLHASYIWPRDQGLFYYWFKTSPETQANFSAWKMVVSLGSPIQSLIILGIYSCNLGLMRLLLINVAMKTLLHRKPSRWRQILLCRQSLKQSWVETEFEQRQKITRIVQMYYCYFWGADANLLRFTLILDL